MTTKGKPDPKSQSLSGITFPDDMRFSDDREGVEARMLLAGYGDRFADLVREHAPIEMLRETLARIFEVMQAASYREITRLAGHEQNQQNRKAN